MCNLACILPRSNNDEWLGSNQSPSINGSIVHANPFLTHINLPSLKRIGEGVGIPLLDK